MIAVVCSLVSVAMDRNADFVAQSELPEIRIADTIDPVEIESNFRQILNEFPFFRKVATYEELLLWFAKHIRVFWDVATWYTEMNNYDFVFGNRFHGNMIALQAGTPACVICHDTRTSEMCEFFGLPSVGLKDIQRVDVDFLYDLVDPDGIQSRYLQLYPEYKNFLVRNGLQPTLE
jgi:polysaccharide pyruvyl transferase WcaK-like protein